MIKIETAEQAQAFGRTKWGIPEPDAVQSAAVSSLWRNLAHYLFVMIGLCARMFRRVT